MTQLISDRIVCLILSVVAKHLFRSSVTSGPRELTRQTLSCGRLFGKLKEIIYFSIEVD